MRRDGFTLVEVLVSLLIFALVAATGTALLAAAVDGRMAIKDSADRTAALQRTHALLKADLSQAVARRTRDETGRADLGSFRGGEGDVLLRLTRAGWSNPDAGARASMQAVEYRLAQGRLERRVRPRLDGAAFGPPQTLQSEVRSAAIVFISQGEERPVWTPTTERPLPDAVRLDLTLEEMGSVSQWFLVGSGRP